jgi:hypothetical protein
MNSKKAITLLVLATLLLSFVPILPVKGAISNQGVYEVTGGAPGAWASGDYYYGDTLCVTGDGVAPGQDIEVWWDGLTKLNTSDGNPDGSFEVWFDVPEALIGDHYIWVKVPSTGEFVSAPTAEIDEALYVGSSIELDPSSGIPGDEITISGYGFGDEVEIVDVQFDGTTESTSPSTPETNSEGSWSATITTPSLAYGTYTVYGEDDDGNTATADYDVGASISLDIDEGPSGTVVRISGRGYTEGAGISNGTIEIGPAIPVGILTEDDVEVKGDSDNTFTIDVVIPGAPEGEWDIVVTEETGAGPGLSASASFEIDGEPSIELSPTYGPVGSTIVVMGYNFSQAEGEEVILTLNGLGDTTVETDANGEFEASFRIPGASGTPDLEATQADYGITATESFRVGFITVVVNPDDGPAGEWVSVTGSGFEPLEDWNATIDGELWMEDQSDGAGVINMMEHIPSLEPGIYEVLITEDDSGIQVSAEFEVTAATYFESSPMVAPAGYEVTFMGYNYATNPGVGKETVELIMYNDTDEWDLGTVDLLSDDDWEEGEWEVDVMLPPDDELSVGMYYVNGTDEEGMFYTLMFEVVSKTVDIEPKMPVFQVGDTLGFDVESSFIQNMSYIEVYDPDGSLYYVTDAFGDDVWINVGTIERVPYYAQVSGGNPMTFDESAPLGEWSWMWLDVDDEELDNGTFVLEMSDDALLGEQVADLSEGLSDLSDQVSGVSDEFDSIRSEIADVASVAADAVAAAESAAEAVNAVAATANTASEAAANAAEAANAAKDAANGLTTLVYGAIGAALVAALAAIVSLMQISRRIAG